MSRNSKIWDHFVKIGPDKNYKQRCAKCNQYDHICNESVIRCEGHLKVYHYVSLEVKQQYFGSTSQLLERNLESINRPRVNMQSFIDRMSQSEQDEIELLLAQAIFQCSLPLSFTELKPIQDLFKKIRPCFKLPCRKRVSTILLDKVYLNTKNEVDKIVNQAEYLSIISDG